MTFIKSWNNIFCDYPNGHSNSTMDDNILIIGGGLQALSVARSLKEVKCRVIALLHDDDYSTYSESIDTLYTTHASPLKGTEYLNEILSILDDSHMDVIIPLSDKTAELLSIHKGMIESKYSTKCAIPSYDVFQKANDKWELLNLCEQYNLPHPRTRLIKTDALKDIADYVGFPALIKPNISVGARGITLVRSLEELKNKYNSVIKQYGESTLQEYIENGAAPYYNVMLYRNSSGEIVNSVVLKIIRYYPINGGSSSFGITIECDELVDICKRCLDVLNWDGFADFDVLQTTTGEFKIIEINPRVPASLRAAEVSGVNFPLIIVNELLKKAYSPFIYKPNKQLRYLGLDLMWFIASERRFSTKPCWFKFFGKDLYYQEKGAMMASLCSGIKKMLSPSFRKSKKGL